MRMASSVLAAILFSSIFLIGITTSKYSTTSTGGYDPWYDLDDDGDIDIFDIVDIAGRYGTTGTPINKTALLLELQARVEGLETRIPKKGYISISASAFKPEYMGAGLYAFANMSITGGDDPSWAPVQLPHNVILTNMTAFILDNTGTHHVELALWGYNLTSSASLGSMAHVNTTDLWQSLETVVVYNDTIGYAQIDNKNCVYSLAIYGTSSAAWNVLGVRGVIIEYEYSE